MRSRELHVCRRPTPNGTQHPSVFPLNTEEVITAANRFKAQKVGATEEKHCVFAACENGHIDPTTPQKTWRSAWRTLRLENIKKGVWLAGFRFHDLRHHAITKLAESGASDQTITAIAGHVSREMLEHYSRMRFAAKR